MVLSIVGFYFRRSCSVPYCNSGRLVQMIGVQLLCASLGFTPPTPTYLAGIASLTASLYLLYYFSMSVNALRGRSIPASCQPFFLMAVSFKGRGGSHCLPSSSVRAMNAKRVFHCISDTTFHE